jgi:phosphoserine aminotransferase
VLKRARGAIWDFDSSGIGILEHSHRGPEVTRLLERSEALCRELAGIPDDYSILFLQGGASSQFFMVPMNFLGKQQTADYLSTGEWSKKAIAEAKRFGNVHIAASSEDENFSYIPAPDTIRWSAAPVYAHFTSNNTIFGTEWTNEPTPPPGVPLICDASSDIFSRPIDVTKYAMIYAGAQKNLGPAGLTLVIVRKDLAARGAESLPTMLRYGTHIKDGSCYNTPPVYAIYILCEVLTWLKSIGGLKAIAEINRDKARLIYDFIDDSKLFRGTARKDSRSLMNICFRATTEQLENEFISEASKRGLNGLKAHRSTGGMRASIYNAFPPAGCQALVSFMRDFERSHR